MSETTAAAATEGRNLTADDLYFDACQASNVALQSERHHNTALIEALRYTMALHDFGRDNREQLEHLFKHHNVKQRSGSDDFVRLIKLVFPHATASHRNCYANSLRGVVRLGKNSDELKATVNAHNGIVALARWEVKQRTGGPDSTANKAKSQPIEAKFTCPPVLPNGKPMVIPKSGVRVWLTERDGKPCISNMKPKTETPAPESMTSRKGSQGRKSEPAKS